MKTYNKISILGLFICIMMISCAPDVDNPYDLKGSPVELPQSWDYSFEMTPYKDLSITFPPLKNVIDGNSILAVHIRGTATAGSEWNWNFQHTFLNNFNGELTSVAIGRQLTPRTLSFYASAISSAGTGRERAAQTITIEAPQAKQTLSVEDFNEEVTLGGETFKRGYFYLDFANATRDITLTGELASDDVIFHLGIFERRETDVVRYNGLAQYFALYWDPVRKNVFLEPPTRGEIVNANYMILSGTGLGRPTTVSHDDIVAAGYSAGRFNSINDASSPLGRIVLYRTGRAGNYYQGFVHVKAGAQFKVFDNTTGGGDATYRADNCFFKNNFPNNYDGPANSIALIPHVMNEFNEPPPSPGVNWWTPDVDVLDEDAIYRITFPRANVTVSGVLETRARHVVFERVDNRGVVIAP